MHDYHWPTARLIAFVAFIFGMVYSAIRLESPTQIVFEALFLGLAALTIS